LVTFAELLPTKKSRQMHKRLKRLRKVSGTARDLDVLAERLRREGEAEDKDYARALSKLYELRSEAQAPIAKLIDDLEASDFPHKIEALCQRIRWRGEGQEPSYVVEARRLMEHEAENFLAAAAASAEDHHALHQLRIAGKQLRYTIEVLAGGLGEAFRGSLYADLRELQDKLGVINDHAVAYRRMQQWSADSEPKVVGQFEQLAAVEQEHAETLRAEFLTWWSGKRCRQFAKKLRRAIAEEEQS
jgi:CHAD domain-containing protein